MAEKESLGHLEFLHRLLAGPVEARRERSLKRRLDNARFRELITLEGFDWQFNAKGLDRRSIEQLVTCDFVHRSQNVILVGQTGLGKSRILQAVGQAACVLGYRVRYATGAELLQKFTEALADGSFNRMLKEYARFDLLLIDEFGFDRSSVRLSLKPARSITDCSTPGPGGTQRPWRPISTSWPGLTTWAILRWRRHFSTGWSTVR